jgi:IrrE N-terminal-like domain
VISRTAAIEICAANFPLGPENLADRLKVVVSASRLRGVEGWCVRGVNTVIRVNSNSSRSRQRFTLAHELAHLILGTQPDIASEPFRSNSQEERDADLLASEFLIPDGQLDRHLHGELPVHAKTIERLAKAANVSPVMTACRVVNATERLGLQNAAVVFFVDGAERWRYAHGLQFDEAEAATLLRQALANKPNIVREENRDSNIVVGSIIDAQVYQVLLIQLLPQSTATQQTREERMQNLVVQVFGDDHSFRQSVAATMGAVKLKCQGQSLEQAIRFFEEHFLGTRYSGVRERTLRSDGGREYVKVYLERWFN